MITLKLKKGKQGGLLGYKTIKILIPIFNARTVKKKTYLYSLVEADGELTVFANEDIDESLEDYQLYDRN